MNYKNLLADIKNAAIDQIHTINIPSDKELYSIDLNTRTIDGPENISVQGDHYADTIYFVVDRFYDHMDLAETNCVIQYVVGEHSYIYAVPYCDVRTFAEDNKIIIPWTVSLSATENAGRIDYFIRFYLIDDNSLNDSSNAEFAYSLCTRPAHGKILSSLTLNNFTEEDKNLQLPERYFEFINLLNKMMDNATTYWIDADTKIAGNEDNRNDEILNDINELILVGENGNWFINGVDTGIRVYPESDYNALLNKPTINGYELTGEISHLLNLPDSQL